MNSAQTNLRKVFLFSLFLFCSFTFVQAEEGKSKAYTDLTKALKNPLDVRVLDLSEQKLKTLPKEIGQLQNLQVLELNNNQLAT
ncbi:leucine rich repeat protein, partial [Leptospira kirschneri str. 200802841]